jgi:hypothetical protein
VLRVKERTPIPYPSVVVTFGLIVKSIKEFKGASLFFPNLPIASPNNEQHNLENKDLGNDGLKG